MLCVLRVCRVCVQVRFADETRSSGQAGSSSAAAAGGSWDNVAGVAALDERLRQVRGRPPVWCVRVRVGVRV